MKWILNHLASIRKRRKIVEKDSGNESPNSSEQSTNLVGGRKLGRIESTVAAHRSNPQEFGRG